MLLLSTTVSYFFFFDRRTKYFRPTESTNQVLNLVAPYQSKLKVFHHIVEKHRTCQSSVTDDQFYGGMGLVVGILQNNYQLLDLSGELTNILIMR